MLVNGLNCLKLSERLYKSAVMVENNPKVITLTKQNKVESEREGHYQSNNS